MSKHFHVLLQFCQLDVEPTLPNKISFSPLILDVLFKTLVTEIFKILTASRKLPISFDYYCLLVLSRISINIDRYLEMFLLSC